MKPRTMLAALAVVALLAGHALAADLEVKLTVTERAGVARTDEPVSGGVPFPKGALKDEDVKNLVLLDAAGKTVPAQFQVTDRWWAADQSVRWVLVSFVASVPIKGTAVYTVKTGGKPEEVPDPIRVNIVKTDDPKAVDSFYDGVLRLQRGVPADKVTLDTGKVKFTVRRKNFNLFDEVWVEGIPVVASHDKGLIYFTNFKGDPANTVLSASSCADGTLEVLESGPVRAVLKATGKFAPKGAMPAGFAPLEYQVFIYAWRGSPIVKVTYAYRLREGDLTAGTPIDGMYVELPLTLTGAKRFALGRPVGVLAGALGDKNAFALADGSDHFTFGGAAKDLATDTWEGRCKNANPWPRDLGWVDLSDDRAGVGVGCRRFWQQWPKAAEARADGSLRLHTWANIDEKVHTVPANIDLAMEAFHSDVVEGRHNMYPGTAKTHDLVFCFHGKEAPEEGLAAFHAVETPAYALCEPSWYCEKSRGFGNLASSNPDLYAWRKDVADAADTFDKKLKETIDFIIKYRGKEYPSAATGKVYDMYGCAYFGNFVNYVAKRGQHLRIDIMWDNNYYDYPVVPFVQFARTGDVAFLEHAIECDQNCYDFEVLNYHPNKKLWGCSRGSPGQDQIRGGYAAEDRRISAPAAASWHKTSFFRWQLLGDYRAYETSYLAGSYPGLNAETVTRSSGHAARSWGTALRNASVAYLCTGDERILEGAKYLWEHQSWSAPGGAYMRGVALEGVAWYFYATGDQAAYPVLNNHHPMAVGSTRPLSATFPLGTGLLYGFERDPRRLDQAVRMIRGWRPKLMWGAVQMAGETLRNQVYATFYLADPSKVDVWQSAKPLTTRPAADQERIP